jgi:hypothetical protein
VEYKIKSKKFTYGERNKEDENGNEGDKYRTILHTISGILYCIRKPSWDKEKCQYGHKCWLLRTNSSRICPQKLTLC